MMTDDEITEKWIRTAKEIGFSEAGVLNPETLKVMPLVRETCAEDAFLFSESKRYDVKGKSYFDSPNKYYSEDIGLRNARIGFRQQEMTHIMENIIYNELIIRQLSVDVGVVYARTINNSGSSVRTPREIDFVVNSGGKRTYIQSAYAMPTDEKAQVELRPFTLTGDSFPKIVVRMDVGKRWYDDNGILNINVIDFLLDKELI